MPGDFDNVRARVCVCVCVCVCVFELAWRTFCSPRPLQLVPVPTLDVLPQLRLELRRQAVEASLSLAATNAEFHAAMAAQLTAGGSASADLHQWAFDKEKEGAVVDYPLLQVGAGAARARAYGMGCSTSNSSSSSSQAVRC